MVPSPPKTRQLDAETFARGSELAQGCVAGRREKMRKNHDAA
jgi:hypothetical protein